MKKKVKKLIELKPKTKEKLEVKAFNSEPRVSLKRYIEDLCDEVAEDDDIENIPPLTPINEMRPVNIELDEVEKAAIQPPEKLQKKPSASKFDRIGRNLYFNGEVYKGMRFSNGNKEEQVFDTEEEAIDYINGR